MWFHTFGKTVLTLAALAVGAFTALPAQASLLVSDFTTSKVLEYNETTGEFIQVFASGNELASPTGLLFAPNGNLLVSSAFTGSVLEYDGKTGDFVKTFASGGGLTNPTGLLFNPNGNLLVADYGTGNILEYDGTTGQFVKTFTSLGNSSANGDLRRPVSLRYGSNNNLLASIWTDGSVVELDRTTGEFVRHFVSPESGGLNIAENIKFAPNGNLLVTSLGESTMSDRIGFSGVLEYDGTTGEFVRTFASGDELVNATGLEFRPNGNVLVGTFTGNVLEYDGETGEFVKTLVPSGSGGLVNATEIILTPTRVPEPSSALTPVALGAVGAGWMLKRNMEKQKKTRVAKSAGW